jgi:hypothetical protein
MFDLAKQPSTLAVRVKNTARAASQVCFASRNYAGFFLRHFQPKASKNWLKFLRNDSNLGTNGKVLNYLKYSNGNFFLRDSSATPLFQNSGGLPESDPSGLVISCLEKGEP